jgi:hypothetical protein
MSPEKQRMFLGLVLAVLIVFLLDIAWPFASAVTGIYPGSDDAPFEHATPP